MKNLHLLLTLAAIFSTALVTGCANDSGRDMSGPAGAGTSGTVQGQGGPGNGPNGAMNGTTH